jgi:phage terminase large subunit
MTTSRAREVDRRTRRAPDPSTMAADFASSLRELLDRRITFPSPMYARNPVGFARDILGIETWSRQNEVLEAVRDHDRVAVRSGHRVGKSNAVAILALWFYCSFDDARVILSSTTARQVDEVLWRELAMRRARAGRCVDCKRDDPNATRIPTPCPHSSKIDGEIGQLARTGLRSEDFREVVGFTAREAEAIQGIAGSRLLFVFDEASGVPQSIFEAMEGNRAGNAKIVLFGNPTRNSGEFFEAFHSRKKQEPDGIGYHTITISSEESPNVVAGRELIPGLATRQWIREREQEWGRDSALFKVRVLGEFATNEAGAIFSVHAIAEAQQRHAETSESGRLYLGVDPAGAAGTGDDSVFSARRGLKQLSLLERRGLDDDGHLAEILGIVKNNRLPRETPVVVIDREGPIGSSLLGRLRAYLEQHPGAFDLVAVRSSDRAVRQPAVYDRMRDELAANLEAWFRDGGAILDDVRLAEELHEMNWEQSINGRLKLTRKEHVRKSLGRSPDRFDALALACWEPLSLRDEEGVVAEKVAERRRLISRAHDDEMRDTERTFDPYRGGLR